MKQEKSSWHLEAIEKILYNLFVIDYNRTSDISVYLFRGLFMEPWLSRKVLLIIYEIGKK